MKGIAKGIKKCNVFIGALFVSEILTLLAFIDVSTTFPSYKHVSNLEGCKDRILAKISVYHDGGTMALYAQIQHFP